MNLERILSNAITPPTNDERAKQNLIQQILLIEMPQASVMDALGQAFSKSPITKEAVATAPANPAAARRAQLSAHSVPELNALLADAKLKQAQQAEQQRFYNHPQARADFPYWLELDFWSVEEAVALMLGCDPRHVTLSKIEADLAPKKGLLSGPANLPTRFTDTFKALLHKAERSADMTTGSRIKPVDAARWAQSQMAEALPEPLARLLDSLPDDAPQGQPEPASPFAQTKVKRAALVKHAAIWPTVETDLNHAARNGLAKAAKTPHFGLWWEEAALNWARVNGRLEAHIQPHALAALPSKINRIK